MKKSINMDVPTAMVVGMFKDKIKSDAAFAEFIIGVLENNYKLDFVLDAMVNGISKQTIPDGEKTYCNYQWKRFIKNADGVIVETAYEIGMCEIKSFNQFEKYYPYTVTFDGIDENGKPMTHTVSVGGEHLEKSK